jgi:hypothetical protein
MPRFDNYMMIKHPGVSDAYDLTCLAKHGTKPGRDGY